MFVIGCTAQLNTHTNVRARAYVCVGEKERFPYVDILEKRLMGNH